MIFVDAPSYELHGRMWCHLISDESEEELHRFARKLRLNLTWYQPVSFPHYDITERKRATAVRLGAREADRREMTLAKRRFLSRIRERQGALAFAGGA